MKHGNLWHRFWVEKPTFWKSFKKKVYKSLKKTRLWNSCTFVTHLNLGWSMDNFRATDPFWVILWDSPSMYILYIAVFHRFTDVLPEWFDKIYAGKGYSIRTQNVCLIDYLTRKGGSRSIDLSFRACHVEPSWAAHSKTWWTVAPWLREDETCSTETYSVGGKPCFFFNI